MLLLGPKPRHLFQSNKNRQPIQNTRTLSVNATSPEAIKLHGVVSRFPFGIALLSEVDIQDLKNAATQEHYIELKRPQSILDLNRITISPEEARLLCDEHHEVCASSGTLRPRKVILTANNTNPSITLLESCQKSALTPSLVKVLFDKLIGDHYTVQSKDFTQEYSLAKQSLLNTIFDLEVSHRFTELVHHQKTFQDLFTLCFAQHVHLTYEVYKRKDTFKGLLNTPESQDENTETMLYIRKALHDQVVTTASEQRSLSDTPSLGFFLEKARPSVFKAPSDFKYHVGLKGCISLYTTQDSVKTTDLVQYLQRQYGITFDLPSINTKLETAKAKAKIQSSDILKTHDSLSLAWPTYTELKTFIWERLQTPKMASLGSLSRYCSILLRKNNHYSMLNEGHQLGRITDAEKFKSQQALQNYVTQSLFQHFFDVPKHEIPVLVQATPAAYGLIHELLQGLGTGNFSTSAAVHQKMDELAQKWLFTNEQV